MRKRRIAFSVNIKTTSLKAAREYAEKEFEKKGKSLDETLPDFDKNYKKLQAKLKGALDIPRISMPVIEPEDMALFSKRLNSGSVDVFAPYARGKFHAPSSLSKEEGEEWVELGFKDGEKSDDMVKGKVGSTPVGKMKPTQSQIWLDKIIKLIIQFGPARSGSPVLSSTVIVSGDNYILDGHHRYAQAMISDQSLKMKSLKVPLPIDLLLQIGKSYGESIGNSAKASIDDERRVQMAEGLVKLAKTLTAKPDAAALLRDAFGGAGFDKAKIVGDSKYSVAVGSMKGKWYGIEVGVRNPQAWEAKSAKALSGMIEGDTGVKTARKRLTSRERIGDTATDLLFKQGSPLRQLEKALVKIREDMRNEGKDREADMFYLDAKKHYQELLKVIRKASR